MTKRNSVLLFVIFSPSQRNQYVWRQVSIATTGNHERRPWQESDHHCISLCAKRRPLCEKKMCFSKRLLCGIIRKIGWRTCQGIRTVVLLQWCHIRSWYRIRIHSAAGFIRIISVPHYPEASSPSKTSMCAVHSPYRKTATASRAPIMTVPSQKAARMSTINTFSGATSKFHPMHAMLTIHFIQNNTPPWPSTVLYVLPIQRLDALIYVINRHGRWISSNPMLCFVDKSSEVALKKSNLKTFLGLFVRSLSAVLISGMFTHDAMDMWYVICVIFVDFIWYT